ncbi:MAG: lipopolysaccharide biosynthesis protein, partial [Bacteroides sp.]|nr:lipopolysaccharide biosynthesis protein [Bacteroides sp.]
MRTILVMLVSLFTSRVVLSALGVDDYGIYNVVGGVVAMFTVVSGALSASISRFVTFELGRNDIEKLKRIFSTSINIQIGISLLILLLGETIGVWFLNYKMNIPVERLDAA